MACAGAPDGVQHLECAHNVDAALRRLLKLAQLAEPATSMLLAAQSKSVAPQRHGKAVVLVNLLLNLDHHLAQFLLPWATRRRGAHVPDAA